jgi:integrase/recombinase XerD
MPPTDSSLLTVSQALPGFVEYMWIEKRFSVATVNKYKENITTFMRDVGDIGIAEIELAHFMKLKGLMVRRGARESRIASVIFALKCLLQYARDFLHVHVIDLPSIKPPKVPRRQVAYLSVEELSRFKSAIQLKNAWLETPRFEGYCLRSLVEVLCASAMRVSEALSLNRDSIDLEKREARIIGKGNKQRIVYFTEGALVWLRRYLELRQDASPSLFVIRTGGRLQRNAVEARFRRISAKAGLGKCVTPHMLRHTAATHLLQKGCPVGYIKEILGHERLETTCHYYLGVLDKADTKRAFESYMNTET